MGPKAMYYTYQYDDRSLSVGTPVRMVRGEI
jgi:hypothetical protein